MLFSNWSYGFDLPLRRVLGILVPGPHSEESLRGSLPSPSSEKNLQESYPGPSSEENLGGSCLPHFSQENCQDKADFVYSEPHLPFLRKPGVWAPAPFTKENLGNSGPHIYCLSQGVFGEHRLSQLNTLGAMPFSDLA